MNSHFLNLPICDVAVDVQRSMGKLEWWRHSVGQGGVNSLPLPTKVVEGIQKLRPRLVRVFIQEFFFIYPDHGTFAWNRLDVFLESFAATGAKIVADLTIKPKVLFPEVNATIWLPNDMEEWQRVIFALVQRYSVEKPYISYWEVGNETEIGEQGGCPYLIQGPEDYIEFYIAVVKAIRAACPKAKVGGPAACVLDHNPMPRLIQFCRETGTPLDFVSFHYYNDDPKWALGWIEKIESYFLDWPGPRPEILLTEWNKDFYTLHQEYNQRYNRMGRDVSVIEMYREPKRAAIIAASVIEMMGTKLDWSFLYSIWDQTLYPDTWRPWFSEAGVRMLAERCNDLPLRLKLFGYRNEADPSFFFYLLLTRMGDEKLFAQSSSTDVRVLAGCQAGEQSVMLVNFNLIESNDKIIEVTFQNLKPGSRRLTIYRIDQECRWNEETLEPNPIEIRDTYTLENFCTQVYLPADSISVIHLKECPPLLTIK